MKPDYQERIGKIFAKDIAQLRNDIEHYLTGDTQRVLCGKKFAMTKLEDVESHIAFALAHYQELLEKEQANV